MSGHLVPIWVVWYFSITSIYVSMENEFLYGFGSFDIVPLGFMLISKLSAPIVSNLKALTKISYWVSMFKFDELPDQLPVSWIRQSRWIIPAKLNIYRWTDCTRPQYDPFSSSVQKWQPTVYVQKIATIFCRYMGIATLPMVYIQCHFGSAKPRILPEEHLQIILRSSLEALIYSLHTFSQHRIRAQRIFYQVGDNIFTLNQTPWKNTFC